MGCRRGPFGRAKSGTSLAWLILGSWSGRLTPTEPLGHPLNVLLRSFVGTGILENSISGIRQRKTTGLGPDRFNLSEENFGLIIVHVGGFQHKLFASRVITDSPNEPRFHNVAITGCVEKAIGRQTLERINKVLCAFVGTLTSIGRFDDLFPPNPDFQTSA